MANAPSSTLEIVQAGFETTPGTLHAATRVVDFMPGQAIMRRTIDTIVVPRAGSPAGGGAAWPGADNGELDIPFYVTPDDWPWWMNLYLAILTTGTGAGANKTYVQTPLDTNTTIGTGGTVNSASFEVTGADTWPMSSGAFLVAGCIGKTLDLTIRPNALWTAKATLMGMLTTQGAKTGALTARSFASYAAGPLTKVYLDTTSGFGTTQLVGRSVSADIKFDIKPQARHTLDGLSTPYRLALPDSYDVTAKIVAEFSSITEYNNWAAKTAQRLRVIFTGATLGAGNYAITLDMGGVWNTSAPLLVDKVVWAIELDLVDLYDAALSASVSSTTVSSVTPLP